MPGNLTLHPADFGAGMNIRWDHFVSQFDGSRYIPSSEARDNRHIQFVREFASVVLVSQVQFSVPHAHRQLTDGRQEKTNNDIDLYKEISRAVDDLATCSYATEAFTELLNQIQATVRRALLFESLV